MKEGRDLTVRVTAEWDKENSDLDSKRAYKSTPWTRIPEVLLSPSKRRGSVSEEEDSGCTRDLDTPAKELDGVSQR